MLPSPRVLRRTVGLVLRLPSVASWSCFFTWMVLWVWFCPLALATEQAEVAYAKGLVAYEERNYLEALDYFRLILESEPNNPHAHFYLGLSFSRLGEFPEAIMALRKVLQLDPSLRHVHYHLAWSYFQDTRYPEALDQFKLAEQFDPRKAVTQFYLVATK